MDEDLHVLTSEVTSTAGAFDHLFDQEVLDDAFEDDDEHGPTRWAGRDYGGVTSLARTRAAGGL